MYIKNIIIIFILAILTPVKSFASNNLHTAIDAEFLQVMRAYHVPVVGYAIIKDYKIISNSTLSIDPTIPVSNASLFQAASISKSIAAYAVLKLIGDEKLALATNVNDKLKTWHIPSNRDTKNNAVTLQQLLNMTSGLTVSGFAGYEQHAPVPTVLEILNGAPPAKNLPVKVFYKPGSRYFYSGGAFVVLEQLIADVVKQPYRKWIQNAVLKQLNMHNSYFEMDEMLKKQAIPGFLMDGKMLANGWYIYPYAAAGGLWSTPSDLAKFAINISQAYLGKNMQIISKQLAKQMLTRQVNTAYGLGVVINGKDKNLNFRKAGHNLGYHSQLLMFPNTGDGIVIMTNSENGEYVINYMIAYIAQQYRWPCYFPYFDELIILPKQTC